jgi:hypothetical protein
LRVPQAASKKKAVVVVVKKAAGEKAVKKAEPVSQAQLIAAKAKAMNDRAKKAAQKGAGGGAKHAGKGR